MTSNVFLFESKYLENERMILLKKLSDVPTFLHLSSEILIFSIALSVSNHIYKTAKLKVSTRPLKALNLELNYFSS